MLKIKKVLYPTDFSRCAEQALSLALDIVRRHGAELHMLHAHVLRDYDPYNPEYNLQIVEDDARKQLEAAAAHRMDSILSDHRTGDVSIKQVQLRGISAGPVLLDYAGEHDIDLIVMGTHGRRGLKHIFLGSIAEEVIRHATCPVLTVREQQEPKTLAAIEKVLVPVDFSPHARQAIVYAKELAADFRARLQLLHIVQREIMPAFYPIEDRLPIDLAPKLEDRAKEELKNLLAQTEGPDVPADVYVLQGHPGHEIVQFAQDNDSDLIVIATHGMTGIEHLLIGSVSEKVARHAPCPVWTVRTYGKSLLPA
jgi:nucleotide-binding universal stress UspA family protein